MAHYDKRSGRPSQVIYEPEHHDGRPLVGDLDDLLLMALEEVHVAPPGKPGYRSEMPKQKRPEPAARLDEMTSGELARSTDSDLRATAADQQERREAHPAVE